MPCCTNRNGPKWKREIVRGHKFDHIDLEEFYDRSCTARLGYLWVYIMMIKSTAVYLADLWTAISLLALDNQLYAKPVIPTETSKWIFLGSIIISYLLLIWDMMKTKKIIQSRDISYTFTSIIASRYYCCLQGGYSYYCLFRQIEKHLDSMPFFVFFKLKGWKRLFLTESPRQVINWVTLVAMIPGWIQIDQQGGTIILDNEALGKDIVQKIMTGTMAFSALIFSISFLLACVAFFLYIPLFCHIQGNLKEYCCHKVDKRIAELLHHQARKRIAKYHKKKHPNNNNNKPSKEKRLQPILPNLNAMYSQPEYAHSDHLGLIANAQSQPYSTPISSYHTSTSHYNNYNNPYSHHYHPHNNNYYHAS
ncbi:hypothetical protein BDA99DRAFT_489305 [Phascolomyces articulosus]|uniref:Uncharacterized protein n=1 Tax=Phascolomyces articulosus TaxID=60185 RepID=A0AAD5P9Z3_9FUNG|nr:hypothetical protein BDA99DRAFT_489305 [Phascolomyces articulosus]